MPTRKQWNFEINGDQHTVIFEEGNLSGKLKVELDGSLVAEDAAGLFDLGKDVPFEVAGRPAILRASYALLGLTADYELVVDGREIH